MCLPVTTLGNFGLSKKNGLIKSNGMAIITLYKIKN